MVAKRTNPDPSASVDGVAGEPAAAQGRADVGVAALIFACDQARRIDATVKAAMSLPGVDLVLVVDDGSRDGTHELARKAGAVVVRHSHRRGRAASLETGIAVIGMRDDLAGATRPVLFLEGSLGAYAVGAAPLVPLVLNGVADLVIALTDAASGERSPGLAAALARGAIARASGWSPLQPLGRIRCITRPALEAALPLSRGAGLGVGMTLDVLRAGFTVTEVECDIRWRAPSGGLRAPIRVANQYRDVMMALSSRQIKGGISATQEAVDRTLHRHAEEEDE